MIVEGVGRGHPLDVLGPRFVVEAGSFGQLLLESWPHGRLAILHRRTILLTRILRVSVSIVLARSLVTPLILLNMLRLGVTALQLLHPTLELTSLELQFLLLLLQQREQLIRQFNPIPRSPSLA